MPGPVQNEKQPARWSDGLSFRLFAITIGAILLIEFVVFLPSAAAFRTGWLNERMQAARIAALSLEAAPSRMVSMELSNELLKRAEVLAVAEISADMREQLLPPATPLMGEMVMVDMRDRNMVSSLSETVETWFAPDGQLMVVRAEGSREGRVLEVVIQEDPLRHELAAFGWRVLGMSLLVSLVAAGLIYLLLVMLVVWPLRRVTRSVEQFRMDPGSWTRRLQPTSRRDEIGRAQSALADMEAAVSDSFRQRERLAQLGEAVAKINHDLRNSLATAQLVSDGLSTSEDPRVQRALPRLERVLQRAIHLTTETLQYGRSTTPRANLQPVQLRQAIEEAALEALARHTGTDFVNEVPEGASALVDPDHIHRIAANLIRNAAEAMKGSGRVCVAMDNRNITFADNGPGLPSKTCDNLFKPFTVSSRRDGSGLGLALSRDLARAMGAELELAQTGPTGTSFKLTLPD